MRAPRTLALYLVLGPLLSCGGGSSSPSPGQDGGKDASSGADAAAEGGGCLPFCGGGEAGPPAGDAATDGPLTCDQMKAQAEALATLARACNPQLPSQCTAVTDGICCPVTVSSGNPGAVNNFDQAVATYKAQCMANCLGVVCKPTPSQTCQGTQTSQGLCE